MTLGGLPLLALLVLSGPAAAPSAEEQRSFAEGLRLLQSGDARGAERAWKAGYAVARDPAFLVRIGEAEEKAAAPREAVESYRRYLRESPDASDREDIEGRVQRLGPPLAAAPAPGAAEIPGEMTAPASAPPPGAPVLGTGPSATGAKSAPPAASPPAAPVPAAAPAAQTTDAEDLRAFVEPNPARRSRLSVAAWTGTGVTVLLLGVAAFYAARASEKSGDVNRLLDNTDQTTGVPAEYSSLASRYQGDVHDGQHADRLAKGFAIAAGATALGSAILFIVDAVRGSAAPEGSAHARRDGSIAPTLTARFAGGGAGGGADLGLGWTF